jgi:iron(III) transport system permease protein
MALTAAPALRRPRARIDWWQGGIMAVLLAILTAFILYPVLSVLWISLSDDRSSLTFIHFANFFRRPLFREALWNTLWSGALVVSFSAILALPLAYLLARYEFRGKLLLQTAATLPLVIPPFVGAVALQLILGRSGMVNLLLMEWFEISIPFMEGLAGVVLVQTLHFFPFILLNTVVSLANIDSSLEEAAKNLGLPRVSIVPPCDSAPDAARFYRRLAANFHPCHRRSRHAAHAQLQKSSGAAGLLADYHNRHGRRRWLRRLRRLGRALTGLAAGGAEISESGRIRELAARRTGHRHAARA